MRVLTSLFILLAFVGCSVSSSSSSPPRDEIEKGVNWSLSAFIDWNYRDKNLFDSYQIINQYTEKRNDEMAYVYDFEADCLVHNVFRASESGQSTGWAQALPKEDGRANKFTGGDSHKFKGTFTLIKKGNTWYRQETIR